MRRDVIDLHAVPEHQIGMHVRLENWGRWCFGTGHAQMAPMFRMYRSTEVHTSYGGMTNSAPVDTADAAKIARGVVALPEDHRHALSWHYVNQGSPARACRRIGCSMEHLARLVVDGRTMLMNRSV